LGVLKAEILTFCAVFRQESIQKATGHLKHSFLAWFGGQAWYRQNSMAEIWATFFNSLAVVLLGVLGTWSLSKRPRLWHRKARVFVWGAFGLSVVLSLLLQIRASLHHQEYNNDLVLRYEDRYEDKMTSQRAEAASAILDYLQEGKWDAVTNQENLDSLEDVLAFFDEIGFYWKHGEISSDVLYEHFYFDMRMYCQESISYIHENQKIDSPADWENVEPLFNELTRIESKRMNQSIQDCTWPTPSLKQNLESEIRRQK
jgi:hypothetical protein